MSRIFNRPANTSIKVGLNQCQYYRVGPLVLISNIPFAIVTTDVTILVQNKILLQNTAQKKQPETNAETQLTTAVTSEKFIHPITP